MRAEVPSVTRKRAFLNHARAGFSEPTEVTDAKVFIAERTKGQGGQKGDFITLAQPSVAINAAGISPRYQMSVTKSITSGVAFSKIIDDIAATGRPQTRDLQQSRESRLRRRHDH